MIRVQRLARVLWEKLTRRRARDARAKPRPRSGCHPRLEALEDRALPSVLTVVNDQDSGAGSLRQALADANRFDVIQFDRSLSGHTIALTSGDLVIDKDLSIEGLGASRLAVSGSGRSREFAVAAGVKANIRGLTLENGNAPDDGGAVLNNGVLTLADSVVVNNTTRNDYFSVFGGGVFNAGTLFLIDSRLSGNSALEGAGLCNAGTARVADSVFSANATYDAFGPGLGGGILNVGTLDVSGSTFAGNSSTSGGAIDNSFGSRLSVDLSTFSGNLAVGTRGSNAGGAILNGGSLSVSRSTFAGNQAEGNGSLFPSGWGGAVENDYGNCTITSCTFFGNAATSHGGAIDNSPYPSGTMKIDNSTFFDNTAATGGAIFDAAPLFLRSCTIDGNSASDSGGGLDLLGQEAVTLDNTIIAGNTAAVAGNDVSGAVTSLGYNLIGVADGSSGWVDSDITGTADNPVDARLGALAYNGGPTPTQALLYDSPAIGAGDPSLAGTLDQRGMPRGPSVDIGAYQTP